MPSLQGLFVQPRKGLDPRVPQTDASRRSTGLDGKLYRLIPKSDMKKYRVMDDQELSLEQRRTQELAASIIDRLNVEERRKHVNMRLKPEKPVRPFSAPEFSRSKKRSPSKENTVNSQHPSKEDPTKQLLLSDKKRTEKILDVLYREKIQMEREIAALKSKLGRQGLSRSTDDMHLRASASADACDSSSVGSAVLRPASASSTRRGALPKSERSLPRKDGPFSISFELQADIDRFIHRRHELEEQEHRARLEQDRYEDELRKRAKRAVQGRPFAGLLRRQKESEAHKQNRIDELKREDADALARDRAEWGAQRRAHLDRGLPDGSVTWRQIEEQETERRKSRAEERRQLTLSSATPFKASEPLAARTRAASAEPDRYVFTAKDPRAVVARLSQQQEAWTARLAELRKSRAVEEAAPPRKLSMEVRAEEYAARSKSIKAARAARQQEKVAAASLVEEKRFKQLLAAKVPAASSRLTRAVEMKIKRLRDSRDSAAAEAEHRASIDKKRATLMLETSVVVSAIVRERETERKQQHGGFTELRVADQMAKDKAAAAKQEFREQLRANRRRIKEALRKRPSLIERHEQGLARRESLNDSLRKVANVVRSDGSGGKTSDYDDLFDDEEMSKLKYDRDDEE